MTQRHSQVLCARARATRRRIATAGILLAMAGVSAWGSGATALDAPEQTGSGTAAVGCSPVDHRHSAWTDLLARHVKLGSVAYAGLARTGRPAFEAYLRSLEGVCKADYDAWSRAQKLAFWINAYNAYTVKLILAHYPLPSIRSIGLLPGAAWREEFIPMQALRGEVLSLNDVEQEILRKEFEEPRIHFAIVCASKGCPALRNEAYRADALERQLDEAASSFVNDRTKNRYDPATRTLHLSSIFDWFRGDFERPGSSLVAFVARHAQPDVARALSKEGVSVEFLEYDWSLNGR